MYTDVSSTSVWQVNIITAISDVGWVNTQSEGKYELGIYTGNFYIYRVSFIYPKSDILIF